MIFIEQNHLDNFDLNNIHIFTDSSGSKKLEHFMQNFEFIKSWETITFLWGVGSKFVAVSMRFLRVENRCSRKTIISTHCF